VSLPLVSPKQLLKLGSAFGQGIGLS
jgi:hypothetical protein